jgi:hypothetical protein
MIDFLIIFACSVSFFAIILASIAIARVARFTKSVHGLDWEAVATCLGDVATVKRSITRLNGRLNGMDNAVPQFDWKEQVARTMVEPVKQRTGG